MQLLYCLTRKWHTGIGRLFRKQNMLPCNISGLTTVPEREHWSIRAQGSDGGLFLLLAR
jgi:hypothetical protein